jgi:hypothetical protein
MELTRETGDEEGRVCGVGYGVGELLSFVSFV